MRVILIAIALLFGAITVKAQDTVRKEQQANSRFYETFYVLKSNKKIRHGLYIAVFNKTNIIAEGEYNNGKRAGQWKFFNLKNQLIQIFNYYTGEFTLIDEPAKKGIKCTLTEPPSSTDAVTRPIIIGGYIVAIMPLTVRVEVDRKIAPNNLEEGKKFYLSHVLSVSEAGVVTKHVITVEIDGKTKTYNTDDSDYNDGSQVFVPAKINGKPVPCELTFKTYYSKSSDPALRFGPDANPNYN